MALRGVRQDGESYIAEAISRGAVAVVGEGEREEESYIRVADAHGALASLAARWYGYPARELTVIGVTGTNGKTTVTQLIAQLLARCCGAKAGLIGTNEICIGGEHFPAERTTPDALTLQRILRTMADAGCTHAVMEVSSHALVQQRVGEIPFALGVFTNLTQDHLDYHGSMEAYFAAKEKLFSLCRCAVINGDDPYGKRLLTTTNCPVTTFGQKFTNDLVGWKPAYERGAVRFTACSDIEQTETTIAIPGAFSLYNALAALAAVTALGIPLCAAAKALPLCHGVRGRAEVVPLPASYTVLIDYAHTPDGLENILSTIGAFAEERVILVFGCGGERDKSKRPQMGRIAARNADLVILTSDNPRRDDPYGILHDILSGMAESSAPFAVLENRREAIFYALDHAKAGDIVLLAGKGHEIYQQIGTEKLPFDEREIIREYFEINKGSRVSGGGETYETDDCILRSEPDGYLSGGACAPAGAAPTQGGAEHP